MHAGYFKNTKRENEFIAPRLALSRNATLSLNDRIGIVHDVLVLKHPIKFVAKKYLKTNGYISNLVKKARDNRNLLREMMNQRDEETNKQEIVKEVIEEMLEKDTFIENI